MNEFDFNKMISQSRQVLLNTSVETFEKFENDGGLKEALIYIAIATLISGLFGLGGGIKGMISNVIVTLFGFAAFSYLVHFMGNQQGGTSTLDQVAYSLALFWAPLSVLFSAIIFVLVITIVGILFIPFVAIIGLIANVYYAYTAAQSSLNLTDKSKIWITLIVASLGWMVVKAFVSNFF